MIKVLVYASDDGGGSHTSRGTRDFESLPRPGELIEFFTSGEAVMVRVEETIHTPDRDTHSAEISCVQVACGTINPETAQDLFCEID